MLTFCVFVPEKVINICMLVRDMAMKRFRKFVFLHADGVMAAAFQMPPDMMIWMAGGGIANADEHDDANVGGGIANAAEQCAGQWHIK